MDIQGGLWSLNDLRGNDKRGENVGLELESPVRPLCFKAHSIENRTTRSKVVQRQTLKKGHDIFFLVFVSRVGFLHARPASLCTVRASSKKGGADFEATLSLLALTDEGTLF